MSCAITSDRIPSPDRGSRRKRSSTSPTPRPTRGTRNGIYTRFERPSRTTSAASPPCRPARRRSTVARPSASAPATRYRARRHLDRLGGADPLRRRHPGVRRHRRGHLVPVAPSRSRLHHAAHEGRHPVDLYGGMPDMDAIWRRGRRARRRRRRGRRRGDGAEYRAARPARSATSASSASTARRR